ncbi:hypothetical protein ACWCP6_21515 [Streptomyces sp. NPDC002004]
MTATPTRYVVVLEPQLVDADNHPNHGPALRTATVEATGELGRSGFPRFAGEGVQADIDPRTRSVEALTVDGRELTYGWTAEVLDDSETPTG